MSRYVQRRTRTRSTTRRRSMLIRLLVGGSVILLLVSFASCPGPEQDSVPIVSQTSQSMEELQDVDCGRLIVEVEAEAEAEVSENVVEVARYSSREVTLVAQTLWGEARGCSRDEQMLVVWCICNRADAREQSIEEVVTAPHQFAGFNPEHPVDAELVAVAEEVLQAWSRNEEALILPPYANTSDYQFFHGDGEHNWFREEY